MKSLRLVFSGLSVACLCLSLVLVQAGTSYSREAEPSHEGSLEYAEYLRALGFRAENQRSYPGAIAYHVRSLVIFKKIAMQNNDYSGGLTLRSRHHIFNDIYEYAVAEARGGQLGRARRLFELAQNYVVDENLHEFLSDEATFNERLSDLFFELGPAVSYDHEDLQMQLNGLVCEGLFKGH